MLEKIKEFFRNPFGKNSPKQIEAPKKKEECANHGEIEKGTNFRNEIVAINEEEKRALKLQKNFKEGLVEEEELSEEEFELLSKLYENQIEKTKQSIQNYKNGIVSIKSNFAQNNT